MSVTFNRTQEARPGFVRRIVSAARAGAMVFAEPKRADLLRELGIAGGGYESGLPVDPYNPDLSGAEWFAKVDEMRRAGGHCTAVETVITLPIVSTEWTVDGESEELVELVRGNLLDDTHELSMSTTWSDVLRRACLGAIYGTWAMEKVWDDSLGPLRIRRLPDRLPHTISEYQFGDDNTILGVVQKANDREGNEVEQAIPIEKLLLFPYRKEGDNWHGLSVLRGAYLHWFCTQMLYRIANIGIERSLKGVPIGTLPANYREEDKKVFLKLLEGLRRHESSGLIMPAGYTIEDLGKVGGERVDFQGYIEHHIAWITRTALADFAILGESARALGDVKVRFFLMAWEGLANEIQAGFNRHLIRQLVAYNAPTAQGADVPRLSHSPIGGIMHLEALGDFLDKALTGGLLVPDAELEDENWIRRMMGMSEREPSQEGAPAPVPAAGEAGEDARAPEPEPEPVRAAERRFAEADVDSAVLRVAGAMDAAEDAYAAAGRALLAEQVRALLLQIDAAGGDPERLVAAVVPGELVAEYGGWIAGWLEEVYRVGAAQMAERIGGAVPEPPASLRARAASIAAHHAEAARFEVVQAALRGESLESLAARYAETMDVRLRGDLTAEARGIAGELNG